MMGAWTVAQVRAAEQQRLAQVPDGALMQRAAAALANVCAGELRAARHRVTGSRVVLLVGAGNNGGDALWTGARLAARGARVDAVLLAPQVHPQGLAALTSAGGRPVRDLSRAPGLLAAADLVVDGIVGLGGSPGLREPAAGLVAGIPPRVRVVAVDLPSGVDPDTGATPGPHVVAGVTVSFGAAKGCLLLPPAGRAAGRVVEVDLGMRGMLPDPAPLERLELADAGRLWPVPGPADDKYRRGVLGVVAGSAAYPGAAVLAVGGALRAGVGMVRYLGPEHAAEHVRLHWPEVVVGDGRVQAWLVGSGVDPSAGDGQRAAVHRALASDLPVVVDAGALAILREACPGGRSAPTLLTPHAGELARLLAQWSGRPVSREDVEAQPLPHARQAAELTACTVLLKGSTTLVVQPRGTGAAPGRVRTQADGPAWLATAGAGDVLAGIAGSLLAGGLDPLDAGSAAALVHGQAASRASGGGPILAQDVAQALPATVAAAIGSAFGSAIGHAVGHAVGAPAGPSVAPGRMSSP